ncbi:SYPH protein, partial [Probosciger aterrimus]|nr:SYPH protein [Probosciger aterrimus]
QVFSIFAFATCGGYSGSLELSIECPPPNRSAPDITVTFGYPFRLHQVYLEAPPCAGAAPERVFLLGDFSSAAQFFVAVGVGAFLSSGAALGGY